MIPVFAGAKPKSTMRRIATGTTSVAADAAISASPAPVIPAL